MAKKKILSIDDLYKFCEEQNFTKFSANESGYQLCVEVPATFQKEEYEDDSLLIGDVMLMHSGKNRNLSCLTEEAAKECLSTIAYKPVLANFCQIDGVDDFTAHDMDIDDDGNIIYIEKQVGCFTADKPILDKEPDSEGRKYIHARVAIPRDYTKAAEIIERKGGTKISAELGINEMSYDAKEHVLMLNSVVVMGATLLGRNPDTGEFVEEGMQGARLDIADFSEENNSVFSHNNKLIETLEKLNDTLSNFNINNQRKEDDSTVNNFEENLEVIENEETEQKPAEEITEEETVVVAEASEEVKEDATEETPEVVDEFDDTEEPAADDSEEETTEEETEEETAVVDDDEASEPKKKVNELEYSATFDGQTRTNFATLNEQLEALWTLVNDTYGEMDNEWYSVDADPDKKLVFMHGWNNHYRQSYKVKSDVFSLVGDRVRVYPIFVTEDEKKELENMKSNYSALENELNEYKFNELHTQREAVLESEEYGILVDDTDFTALKEVMDDYSPEELSEKCDLIYAKYMKSNYSKLSAKPETSNKHVAVFMSNGDNAEDKKRKPYGGIFDNYFKNKQK